jgi:hypothetical protein
MLTGALVSSAAGLGWLALSMDVHWRQVRGTRRLSRGLRAMLRVLGASAIAASFALCFAADHVSMAPLVWVMTLAAGGALIVALTLAWRPGLLRPLVVWLSTA